MSAMTGGEAIVGQLLRHGVDTVFGLPGAQTYGLFDALHRHQDSIRVIGARHEQACAYMAMGYTRATGRPGVCSVVPGPGILNASAALLTAFGVNAPVLALTGQVPRAFFGRGRGHLHEMPDQLGTVAGFTKWADRIEYPAEAPQRIAEAFRQMTSGRCGPAVLETFWDTFTETAEIAFADPLPPLPNPPVDSEAIEAANRYAIEVPLRTMEVAHGTFEVLAAMIAEGNPNSITDAAVNIQPTLEEKRDIVQSAIELMQALGIAEPRVAILAAVETVTSRMPSTLDAAALCKMADRGQIVGGLLDGPLAFDNAISPEAAATKHIVSPVAGRPDVLVVPDIEAGNMLAKQLTFLAGADAGGLVLGARVPIVLTSRADSILSRRVSAALAVAAAAAGVGLRK